MLVLFWPIEPSSKKVDFFCTRIGNSRSPTGSFNLNILGLKDVEIALPQRSMASINVEFVVDPDWSGFEFITKKKGAQGPTKEECENYYTDW